MKTKASNDGAVIYKTPEEYEVFHGRLSDRDRLIWTHAAKWGSFRIEQALKRLNSGITRKPGTGCCMCGVNSYYKGLATKLVQDLKGRTPYLHE